MHAVRGRQAESTLLGGCKAGPISASSAKSEGEISEPVQDRLSSVEGTVILGGGGTDAESLVGQQKGAALTCCPERYFTCSVFFMRYFAFLQENFISISDNIPPCPTPKKNKKKTQESTGASVPTLGEVLAPLRALAADVAREAAAAPWPPLGCLSIMKDTPEALRAAREFNFDEAASPRGSGVTAPGGSDTVIFKALDAKCEPKGGMPSEMLDQFA
jgi:hypothetical protein